MHTGWGVALDVTRAVDLFGDYLETLGGVVAPHVLVAIDAFELKQVGARCRRAAGDALDLGGLLKAEKASLDDGPTPLRQGSTGGLLLRAVEGEDDYEAGAVEFARFLLEVVGFRGVVLVDARHALLYERGSLTTLAVDLSPSAASCLAVYEGTPVGAALAPPAELGSAVAAAVDRGPVDAARPLAAEVYVAGSGVDAAGGAAAIVASIQAVLADTFPNLEARVVVPPHAKYASWNGAKALASLDDCDAAFRGHTGDAEEADLVFDIRHSTARTLAPYWRLLRGVQPDGAAPAREPEAAGEGELLALIDEFKGSDAPDAPHADFLAAPHALGNLWLPRWGPWGCLRDPPDDDDAAASGEERAEEGPAGPTTAESVAKLSGVEYVANCGEIGDDEFALVLAAATSVESVVDAVLAHKDGHLFKIDKIVALLGRVDSVKTKLAIAELLGQRCSDPKRASKVVDLFVNSSDKEAVSKVFADRAKVLARKTSQGASPLARGGRGGRGGRGRGRGRK